MSVKIESDDDDTITISSSILPYEEDSGIVNFSEINSYDETSPINTNHLLSTGCTEECYENLTIINKESVPSEEKLEKYSTDELLKELMRRKQLPPTNALEIPESENKGNRYRGDQSNFCSDVEHKEFKDSDQGIGSMESLDMSFFKLKMRSSSQVMEQIVDTNPSSSGAAEKNNAIMEAAIKREKDKMLSTKTKQRFKKQQETLAKLIIDNSSLDVAFLVDCTGSMSKYIEQTKENIEFIVNSIKEDFENKVKISFVGYRDHEDGDGRIECLGFTEDVHEFKQFVEGIEATGGDDCPEDVLGGLEAVKNLTWTCKNRILIHVADAPQHGPRFHDLGEEADNYFTEEPRGLKVENLFDEIKFLNVKYFFAKINDSTDKMVKEFNNVAGYDLVKNINLKSPDLIAFLVLNSITQTLDESISDTMRTFQLSTTGSYKGKTSYTFYFFIPQFTQDTQVTCFSNAFLLRESSSYVTNLKNKY